MVDVADCPELQLVLPARKEVVVAAFLDELRAQCERTIYRHIASLGSHRLSFKDWQRARALGVSLPEALAKLRPWSPVTNDGQRVVEFRTTHGDAETPLPAEAVIMADTGPDLEQSLARALERDETGFGATLVEACDAYQGYAWYDALPRVTEVVGAIIRGDEQWSTDRETEAPPSGRVDRVSVALTIMRGRDERIRPLETDMLLLFRDDCWTEDPDEQHVFVTAHSELTPLALADRIVSAFFIASDDRDADSWDTQHERYQRQAIDLARRLLLGDEEADLARIRDVLQDRIAWLVPKARGLHVRYDGSQFEIALTALPEPSSDATSRTADS